MYKISNYITKYYISEYNKYTHSTYLKDKYSE